MKKAPTSTMTHRTRAASLLFVLTLLAAPAAAHADYQFSTKWGSQGTLLGQFNGAYGLAVDGTGNVYVADGNSRVQEFGPAGGFPIGAFGGFGTADGQFEEPSGVAAGPLGDIYVADEDSDLDRVQDFSSAGTFIRKWGSPGTGDSQFSTPKGVGVDASGDVYVADQSNNRIEEFSSLGGFIRKWGSFGPGDAQFIGPEGVAVDAAGNVYVADPGNSRIEKFTSTGGFIRKWGSLGSGDGQFSGPSGVAVSSSGSVFVTDVGNDRVEEFSATGDFIRSVGSHGSGDGQFTFAGFGLLSGVGVDSAGNLYVSDSANNRVEKFAAIYPQTTITAGPANGTFTADPTPTFSFTSSEGNSTFECRADSGSWINCVSPHTTGQFADGAHTYEIRATDVDGLTDKTPASRSFTVDTAAPQTTITAGPANGSSTNDPTPTFSFTSSEAGSTFECRADSGSWINCASPHTTGQFADGAHTYEIRATDQAGNADQSPAIRSFTVDTAAPETTISDGPTDGSVTSNPTPTFSFTSSEPGSTFECRADSGSWINCASPHTTGHFADGAHTYEIRATDQAGNADQSPANRSFTVDTAAPQATVPPGSSPPASTKKCKKHHKLKHGKCVKKKRHHR
jgi:hypothetical protein